MIVPWVGNNLIYEKGAIPVLANTVGKAEAQIGDMGE